MALDSDDLADIIKESLGFGALATSDQTTNVATAIVVHIKTALVNFLPGTITGTAPPAGGPLEDGQGAGGLVVLVPAALEAAFVVALGNETDQIKGMGRAISLHLMTGTVSFGAGDISGSCTNTTEVPGVLIGAGADGVIVGLDGTLLAAQIAIQLVQGSVSDELQAMCDDMVTYIMDNAEVSLPSQTFLGAIPAGGGPSLPFGTVIPGVIT